jgi:glycine/D-amino acid oxidase-like deaminating enzyme
VLEQPYWQVAAPHPTFSLDQELPEQTDVAVIGGGYTGISAARTLAQHGLNVTVLEAETLGWGASTRNGGFVLPGFKLGTGALLRRFGLERARALYDASRESLRFVEQLVADEGIDCEFRRCGHVSLAYRPSHYRRLAEIQGLHARAFAHETTLIPVDRLSEVIGSAIYHGGLLDLEAASLHPAKYFWGLAAAARRAGARLVEHTEVRSIGRIAGGFTLDAGRRQLRAGEVILATNGYSGRTHTALRRRIIPLGSYLIATAPLEDSLAAELIPQARVLSDTKNLLFYFRLSEDRRMLFGGRVAFGSTTPADAARHLAAGMRLVFPQLRDTTVEYTWSGKVAFTIDQLPHAGVWDGVHFALGYCGHGVAMATFLGARLGAALAGRGDLLPFSDLSFPAVPLYDGRPWFLPLVGAWYRLVDRIA